MDLKFSLRRFPGYNRSMFEKDVGKESGFLQDRCNIQLKMPSPAAA
jgi:hypothetical protein